MRNVTKTNILFTFMVAFYLMFVFILRLIPTEWVSVNVRLILPELIMLIPSFLYVTLMKPEGINDMRFEVPSFLSVVRIFIITICAIPFIGLINSLSTIFVENQVEGVMGLVTGNPLWLNVVLMALVPAVCEEYIFRGLIFHGYKKKNPFGAMLMSSLLFGLIHMNVNQFIYAFIMGIAFCLIVYATGTVMSSIIAHFIFNAFNVIMSHKAADILNETENVSTEVPLEVMDYVISYGIMVMIALAGLVGAYRMFKRLCDTNRGFANVMMVFKRENRKSYEDGQGKFFDGYVAVGIILCIGYILVYGL